MAKIAGLVGKMYKQPAAPKAIQLNAPVERYSISVAMLVVFVDCHHLFVD